MCEGCHYYLVASYEDRTDDRYQDEREEVRSCSAVQCSTVREVRGVKKVQQCVLILRGVTLYCLRTGMIMI